MLLSASRKRIIFQSTLPAWGETALGIPLDPPPEISIHSPRMGRDQYNWPELHISARISIHSPRMGRDCNCKFPMTPFINFNPLSPHGERPALRAAEEQRQEFQSTLPAWGETVTRSRAFASSAFQSTLPAWGETGGRGAGDEAGGISIHSPRMGRDTSAT